MIKMTTKYIIKEENYTDVSWGRGSKYIEIEGKFETLAEAKAYGIETVKATYATSGDFVVVERTIDEATFTVTENEVFKYDYFKAVKVIEYAEKEEKAIAEAKAELSRARSEKSITRITKKIAEYEATAKKYRRINEEYIATI
jgi:hypothetical protein